MWVLKNALLALNKLESIKPFTENEAWGLFRIAAFSEAIGWTLLISGILINHYDLPGRNVAIPIAGEIHGTIFLVYFGVTIAIYSSLGWSRKKFMLAILAGIPPYGSLIFEQFAAHSRWNKNWNMQLCSIVLVSIIDKA